MPTVIFSNERGFAGLPCNFFTRKLIISNLNLHINNRTLPYGITVNTIFSTRNLDHGHALVLIVSLKFLNFTNPVAVKV